MCNQKKKKKTTDLKLLNYSVIENLVLCANDLQFLDELHL